MTWWNIIKISEKAKDSIVNRFKTNRKTVGQSHIPKGEAATSAYKNCEMCGKRKSLRAINYYPPMKALCNDCAKFSFGDNYKAKAVKIEPD